MGITFSAESISVEPGRLAGELIVTVQANAREVVEDMDLDDRLYELEPREIIDEIGALKLLQAFDDKEITKWLQDADTDPIDVLNAIGIDAIHDYLSNID